MKYTEDDIVKKLKGYHDLKTQVMQLEFELSRVEEFNGKDVIETMNFYKGDGMNTSAGKVTDKTSNIAATYEDTAQRTENRASSVILRELALAVMELERIEFYVKLLNKKECLALTQIYLENKTYSDIAAEFQVSNDFLRRHRKAGIQKLTAMYNRIAD